MTSQTEALKLALDLATMHHTDDGYAELRSKVRQLAKEALAQPEQDPVAWAENDGDGNVLWNKDSCFSDDPEWLDNPMPLYTTPPQRTWVGLSLQEQAKIMASIPDIPFDGEWHALLLNTIEAKLKEKNA